jgi:hypothetical protein
MMGHRANKLISLLWALLQIGSIVALQQPALKASSTSANNSSRRTFLASSAAAAFFTAGAAAAPSPALARLVMNEETGDYDDVEEPAWQETWKGRLDKAQNMSSQDVFMAARGASNVVPETESNPASRKRRAMSACREPSLLQAIGGVKDTKECSGRVIGGDLDFIETILTAIAKK